MLPGVWIKPVESLNWRLDSTSVFQAGEVSKYITMEKRRLAIPPRSNSLQLQMQTADGKYREMKHEKNFRKKQILD